MFAAEEDRLELRNLDDSDAHSEATGTTEEDLRPVKVHCSLACIALYMHSVHSSLVHSIMYSLIASVTHLYMRPSTFVSQATKQAHLVTGKCASCQAVCSPQPCPCLCPSGLGHV